MSKDIAWWVVWLVILIVVIVGFVAYSFAFPNYKYQGVTEMTQQQYTEFMNKYGFDNKDQQSFATAYNDKTDKLMVTYNFESRQTNLEKYGVGDGKMALGDVVIAVFIAMLGILVMTLTRPSKND